MRKLFFLVLVASLFLSSCSFEKFMIRHTVKDKHDNVYAIVIDIDPGVYYAEFNITINGKEFTCGVNYEKAKDEPFSYQTDFDMFELTGSFIVGIRGVTTLCGVTNKEDIAEIVKHSVTVEKLINAALLEKQKELTEVKGDATSAEGEDSSEPVSKDEGAEEESSAPEESGTGKPDGKSSAPGESNTDKPEENTVPHEEAVSKKEISGSTD